MSRTQSSFAYAALLLGMVAFASSFVRTTSGQQPADRPAVAGRYAVASSASNGYGMRVFVTDTATGRTWCRDSGSPSNWTDLGSPTIPK